MERYILCYVLLGFCTTAFLAAIDHTGNPDTNDATGSERKVLRGIAGIIWPAVLLGWAVIACLNGLCLTLRALSGCAEAIGRYIR